MTATQKTVINGSASLDIVLRGTKDSSSTPVMQAGAVAAVALAGAISVIIWKRRRRSA
jgi:acetylornithine deacetylase/succinyl-diaminopimelate desuccinylase-like protein